MTAQVQHVNSSDARFMVAMIALLRHGVRDGILADQMAARHHGDPRLRSLVHDSSRSAARQITAMISCLHEWDATIAEALTDTDPDGLAQERADVLARSMPETIRYDDELVGLDGRPFDARVTRNRRAHHRAVIALSREEMVAGINPRSRDFARAAISQHSRELGRLTAYA